MPTASPFSPRSSKPHSASAAAAAAASSFVAARTGWSAPAYLNVGGASFGLQIGAEATDYVMLFMTPESARSLLETNIKLGGNVSVAAGPIGREAGAATDLKLTSQILSYSRSKGLFAGAALEGAVIETADKDMRDVYGANVTAREVLFRLGESSAGSDGVRQNRRRPHACRGAHERQVNTTKYMSGFSRTK